VGDWALTDADSSLIINQTIRPKMRAGDVDGAVQAGVDQMLLTITPSFKNKIGHKVASAQSSDDGLPAIIGTVVVFMVIFWLIGLAARRQRRRGGHGGLWFLAGALSSGGWGSSGGGLGGGGFGGGFGGGGASGGW